MVYKHSASGELLLEIAVGDLWPDPPSESCAASDMAFAAAEKAIGAAGLDAQDIDLIIVATTTPDKVFPSTACIVQRRLGIAKVPAFDVHAACSGFIDRCSFLKRWLG